MISLSGFWSTIILLGIVQGLILSGLLFASRRHQLPSRILAVLIGLITLACLNIYLLDVTWYNTRTIWTILANALPLVVIMPIGPLIWCYVQASMDPSFTFSRKYYIHFYPVLIDLIPYTLAFMADMAFLNGMASQQQRSWISGFADSWNVYADIPRWFSITIYCWLSRQYIMKRKSEQLDIADDTARWLQQFLFLFLVFQGIWLLYLVPYIIPATRQPLLNAVGWYPIFVPLAVLIYWLGLKGYLVNSRITTVQQSNKTVAPASRLPDDSAEAFIQRLQKLMEAAQLYLDPSLTVNSLAQQAGMPAKTVSAVLNQHLDKSFSTFVNEYRVAAFKRRILQQDASQLTIPGIAMECGFSSPATFQRIFKQLTGTTPSRFIQEAKQAETP
ncbi:helix-turn-helix domain-containing protein [Paraflavitalea soli]|nr:helix-turn-helix domain-containing protein [Paraflavitalea soli]